MAMERLEFTGDNFSGYLWGFIEQRCVLFESRELQNALQNPIETSWNIYTVYTKSLLL